MWEDAQEVGGADRMQLCEGLAAEPVGIIA